MIVYISASNRTPIATGTKKISRLNAKNKHSDKGMIKIIESNNTQAK